MESIQRKIKDLLPPQARRAALQARADLQTVFTTVRRESQLDSIYHCCVQKTASQWLRRLLSDPIVYKYSGLGWYQYPAWMDDSTERPIVRQPPETGFPSGRIVSPLYISHENLPASSSDEDRAVFFVKRDPRDIVVSFYFSKRDSHLGNPYTDRIRGRLRDLDKEDGLIYVIDELEAFLFPSLRSWEAAAGDSGEGPTIWRYEDLTGPDGWSNLRGLLSSLDIEIPKDDFARLRERYSWKQLAGRDRGTEDRSSNLRKGVHGDWEEHFSKQVEEHFVETTDAIHRELGYE